MQYLIDTHVCIWAIADKKRLSNKVIALLENNDNKIFVSQISIFEIAIKIQTGKFVGFSSTISELIKEISLAGFEILPFKNEHAVAYSIFNFSTEHRDPFDRYLLITSIFEKKVPFITIDDKFQLYADIVEIIW